MHTTSKADRTRTARADCTRTRAATRTNRTAGLARTREDTYV